MKKCRMGCLVIACILFLLTACDYSKNEPVLEGKKKKKKEGQLSESSIPDMDESDLLQEDVDSSINMIENYDYLVSTNDTTDRTAEIEKMLNTGICNLGPGDFYVTGVSMPVNSRINGSGNSTRIILNPDITNGFALKANTGTSISNLKLVGSVDPITTSSSIGNRHGILFYGNADHDADMVPMRVTIDNITVNNFHGGGITLNNTGLAAANSMLVSNVFIYRCDAGINVAYLSEYSSFTNISVIGCYYGCICNGGNNKFSNCGFTRNTVHVKFDNSHSQSRNSGHGVFSCCSFNHAGNNDGIAIEMYGIPYGELFDACQIHYGEIIVDKCSVVMFSGCEVGRNVTISVRKSNGTAFNNIALLDIDSLTASIEDSPTTRFVDCFSFEGDQWDPMTQ